MYKLIASDLDGTLLKDDKTISKETIETLKKLNEKGVLFVPSTGRCHKEIPQVILDLPFVHYALCVNGGGIYDYRKQKYIYEETIDSKTAWEVFQYAKSLNVYTSFVIEGNRYLESDENGNILPYIQQVAVPSILKLSYPCMNIEKSLKECNGIQKFLFYTQNEQHSKQVVESLSNQFANLSVCCSGPIYVEVNAKGVNKGKGLQTLCDRLNIDIQDTIAFGDAANDIDLLDVAGFSVAMENGTQEAKQHADFIAKSNNEDGLRLVLENM